MTPPWPRLWKLQHPAKVNRPAFPLQTPYLIAHMESRYKQPWICCQTSCRKYLTGGTLNAQNPIRLTLTEPQERFLMSDAKHPAFVAGLGAGKSEVMIWSAIGDAAHSANALIGMYAPTYDLVRLITAPRLCARLDSIGVPYKWNKSENIVYTNWPRFGDFVLRTMDNPERIVGYETYRAHCDELDTLKVVNARKVWNNIVARNRQRPEGIKRPFNRVSAYTTPEGFRFVYERWAKQPTPGYEYFQAPTYSNPFLPADYVNNLRNTYPPELIDAYIEGRFVNLTSGTVYRSYGREVNRSRETIQPNEPIKLGMDFNVGNMAACAFVLRAKDWHCVDELKGGADTPSMIQTIKTRYEGHHVTIYPDASGASASSKGASLSDIGLLRAAGYSIRAKGSNPRVKDRINAVNLGFHSGKLWVNPDTCPETSRCLEQQSYDKNGEPDKTSGLDHQNDAFGYPIAYEMPVIRPTMTAAPLPF